MVGRVGSKERGEGRPVVCIHTRRNEKVVVCPSSVNCSDAALAQSGLNSGDRRCMLLAYEEVTRGATHAQL